MNIDPPLPVLNRFAKTPQVVADGPGNVVAVWVQGLSNDASTWRVWASPFTAATGRWGDSAGDPRVLSGFDRAEEPQVAINPAGNPVAVWAEAGPGYDIVYAANYTTAFSPPKKSLSGSSGQNAGFPEVAVDTVGNAIAVWVGNQRIDTARYVASSGTWRPFIPLSSGGEDVFYPQVAFDKAGNAFAVWMRGPRGSSIIQAVRYTAANDTWSSAHDLSAPGQVARSPAIVIDAAGNATAIWSRFNGSFSIVQASRYTAATATWSGVTDLSANGSDADGPSIAVDTAGNATAVWERGPVFGNGIIQTSRFTTASNTWSSPVDLSATGQDAGAATVAVDPFGNAMAIWNQTSGSSSIIYTRRYIAPTATWEATTYGIGIGSQPRIAIDGFGNATAVWIRAGAQGVQIQRWLATPVAPTIKSITPGKRRLFVAFKAPAARPGFVSTNYEYSLDNGMTWVVRSPSSTASPITINGLRKGTTYRVALRAVNGAGTGAASVVVNGVPK